MTTNKSNSDAGRSCLLPGCRQNGKLQSVKIQKLLNQAIECGDDELRLKLADVQKQQENGACVDLHRSCYCNYLERRLVTKVEETSQLDSKTAVTENRQSQGSPKSVWLHTRIGSATETLLMPENSEELISNSGLGNGESEAGEAYKFGTKSGSKDDEDERRVNVCSNREHKKATSATLDVNWLHWSGLYDKDHGMSDLGPSKESFLNSKDVNLQRFSYPQMSRQSHAFLGPPSREDWKQCSLCGSSFGNLDPYQVHCDECKMVLGTESLSIPEQPLNETSEVHALTNQPVNSRTSEETHTKACMRHHHGGQDTLDHDQNNSNYSARFCSDVEGLISDFESKDGYRPGFNSMNSEKPSQDDLNYPVGSRSVAATFDGTDRGDLGAQDQGKINPSPPAELRPLAAVTDGSGDKNSNAQGPRENTRPLEHQSFDIIGSMKAIDGDNVPESVTSSECLDWPRFEPSAFTEADYNQQTNPLKVSINGDPLQNRAFSVSDQNTVDPNQVDDERVQQGDSASISSSQQQTDSSRDNSPIKTVKITDPIDSIQGGYGDEDKREATFDFFPIGFNIRPLSTFWKAGFFYTRYNDRMQCFFCSRIIENWGVEDDPNDQHFHRPSCNRTRLNRPQAEPTTPRAQPFRPLSPANHPGQETGTLSPNNLPDRATNNHGLTRSSSSVRRNGTEVFRRDGDEPTSQMHSQSIENGCRLSMEVRNGVERLPSDPPPAAGSNSIPGTIEQATQHRESSGLNSGVRNDVEHTPSAPPPIVGSMSANSNPRTDDQATQRGQSSGLNSEGRRDEYKYCIVVNFINNGDRENAVSVSIQNILYASLFAFGFGLGWFLKKKK